MYVFRQRSTSRLADHLEYGRSKLAPSGHLINDRPAGRPLSIAARARRKNRRSPAPWPERGVARPSRQRNAGGPWPSSLARWFFLPSARASLATWSGTKGRTFMRGLAPLSRSKRVTGRSLQWSCRTGKSGEPPAPKDEVGGPAAHKASLAP